MLSPRVQLNLQNAKNYFLEHLSGGDYYSEKRTIAGEWFGLGAEKLGLKGTIQEAPFLALCEGLHPTNVEWLSQRKNTMRRENGKSVANRRVFYDFTISPPKTISLVGLYQDARIVELHNRSVRTAMHELEKFAQARVRKGAQNTDRVTGNVIGAAFQHDTSRELDPHLHTHCVLMNATFDPVENAWKALEASSMYAAQKFAENLYYHELAKGLVKLGYEGENTALGPQIKHVPASLVRKFSKRHEQINTQAQSRIEREGQPKNVNDLREQVAHDGRRPKSRDATAERLRPFWSEQMTDEERTALNALRNLGPRNVERADASRIVAWADEHLFQRRSVIQDYELLSTALAHGRGQNVELPELIQAMAAQDYHREKDTRKIASRSVLRSEIEIVIATRNGKWKYEPFNRDYEGAPTLSAEQRRAVKHILGSRDFITLFRGAAGTGKSFALKEVQNGLATSGRQVVVLAPQRQQVLDLQKEGLAAQTLAQLLVTKKLPQCTVVMVDEAGQIGGRQLHELIHLVRANEGRLIRSGDTRQHGAVTASDALRAIEQYGEIKPAEIQTIRRQDPNLGKTRTERTFIRHYRAAVKAVAKGNVLSSFDQLDQLGCVRELPPEDRRVALAAEYLSAGERKETALVVAQTWDEVRNVNEAIRGQLRASGKIGAGETLITYRPIDSTAAQRRDKQFYQAGQFVSFLQGYGRYAKGDFCEVLGATDRGVILLKDGRRSTVSFNYTERMIVASAAQMEVAPGDRLQLKFNGRSVEGSPLTNGELVTVNQTVKDGTIVIENASGTHKTLTATQRLFNRGYAVTSYASQGKTVDTVLFADASNPAATNQNQWYVAISRGRKRAMVFTSDKAELRANIQRSGNRELALDLKPDVIDQPIQKQDEPIWLKQVWQNIKRRQRALFVQARRNVTESVQNRIHL